MRVDKTMLLMNFAAVVVGAMALATHRWAPARFEMAMLGVMSANLTRPVYALYRWARGRLEWS